MSKNINLERLTVQAYRAQEKAKETKEKLRNAMLCTGIKDVTTGAMVEDKEIVATLSDDYIAEVVDMNAVKAFYKAHGMPLPMVKQDRTGPFSIKLRLPKKEARG